MTNKWDMRAEVQIKVIHLHDMRTLTEDIIFFLESNGFKCSRQIRHDMDVICTGTLDGHYERVILPLDLKAATRQEAEAASGQAWETISAVRSLEGFPLIITEDRWNRQRSMMEARLLAHLELFSQAYARNCEVRRIDKTMAQEFLSSNHSYGYAACRYRYGLFLKRHTGHIAEELNMKGAITEKLIAVATFSNARKWIKDGKEIRSYEWTRYASLPDMRISGGMGKLLKAFIKEVQPDDIMSYADLEWSEGDVYSALGFKREDSKDAVEFVVDPQTWERKAIRNDAVHEDGKLYFRNFGSSKFRLKLTDYRQA